MIMPPRHLLVVEDSPSDAQMLTLSLRRQAAPWLMSRAETLAQALDRLASEHSDAVLLDLGLPDSFGLETFTRIAEAAPRAAIVVLSGNEDEEVALEAVRAGAQDFLVKGRQITYDILPRALAYAVERKRIALERDQLVRDLQQALAEVKTLQGLLPICSGCKRIRDDNGYWNQIERYIAAHSNAEFTHSFCPPCMQEMYGELEEAPEALRQRRAG